MNVIVASHNEEILVNNLMQSVFPKEVNLIIMRGYDNVSKAYNEAILKTKPGFSLFIHHDVYLPDGWFKRLHEVIEYLESDKYGVIGVAGADYHDGIVYKGNIINGGERWHHGSGDILEEVQTVDELLFLVRTIDASFDETLGNHFYCADLCLRLAAKGKKNYVMNNICSHNGTTNNVKDENGKFVYSEDFYRARDIMAKKYTFPIATTCTTIN